MTPKSKEFEIAHSLLYNANVKLFIINFLIFVKWSSYFIKNSKFVK